MTVKKLINPEQLDELTAKMRSEFTPEYFRKLRSEFQKERVMKYFGPKQEPGIASALWRDDPETYLKAKMAGVYFYDLPNQLLANLRLTGPQLNKLQQPELELPKEIPENEQFKERLR